MIRAITVAREYGSGGGAIAASVARRLGWELMDKKLLHAVAEKFQLRDSAARRLQERGSWWLERIARAVWLETGGTAVDVVDAESVHEFTKDAIWAAYRRGNCVIVGRGAQCVLRGRPDVLHVFVFAPLEYRMSRLTGHYKNDREALESIARIDEERASYIREFYDTEWKDASLYDLWINGKFGVLASAEVLENAVKAANKVSEE